ncbi:glycosyltransferase family 4 protein [Lactobacillus delbrueckii]|uniref:Glycosyltransferase family 4 protein n=1 Tax=Lactobacillus delbrueckii subsp. lactis TaxID=29397 RepID=A0ABD4SJZ2_LACDL|nr:glycosyltransferase family 4 protein [Lactobacillus delbrueckii]MCD5563942.1 glycosyltransferase family 4 protein [Lactobacillus delbrueckii subsp. lactis]GHN29305.1 glycosyl transferase [Lactobacillus delbrueckii]
MKNILYLHAGAEMYGADKVLLELVSGLDKTEFNPIVVLPNDGILRNKMQENGIEVHIVDYPILRRKYFNPKGIAEYSATYFNSSKEIVKLLEGRSIDIIHVNTTAVLEGIYLKKKLRSKLIWHVHEIILQPRAIYKFLSLLIGKYADKTVAVSKAVKQHLIDSGYIKDNQVEVIYNGVDSDRFSPNVDNEYLYEEWNVPKDAIKVGMIGRVNAWKGQGDFLNATEGLLKKYPNLYLFIVGSAFAGEEWRVDELKQEIAEIPEHDRIIFSEFRTDTPAIHNFLDVFVLPSTNPDPLPTVVLEAMATGKPVVGYRHGGVCEMVKEGYNGLLAEVRNPTDLAKKVDTLLSNEELRKTMGEHSRDRLLENFSIESYVKNYSDEYDRLTAEKY